ncbi:hypothetical protein JNJ66_06295 [Candidatus Saccharibacteria bacterium]|nr:hypothetical protein [Candidatus Saccharibacteria bacterium]
MKKNDIALIILVVSISLVTSYFLLGAIMGKPSTQKLTAEVVEPISPSLETPSPKIFNDQAIDPTVQINIGDAANTQPFQQ